MNRFLLSMMAVAAVARAQTAQTLTVDEAVAEAIKVNDQLRAARFRAEGAEDTARSVRGQLLPQLNANNTWQHYDSPFVIALGPPTSPPITARNINANTFTVSAQQPVLGLFHRVKEFSAAGSAAEASRADEATTRAQLAEQVRVNYLRLFEARAAIGIAQASIEQLQKQVQDAKARYDAGTITKADLLRFETAVANARQQLILATTLALTAQQALLTLLARNPEDTSVTFVEPLDLEKEASLAVPGNTDALINQALDNRPEVTAARKQADAARSSGDARMWALLPEVDIQAAYANVRGQIFAPENSFFVGVAANWPFWTWGTKWYAAQSAQRQADAASALHADTRKQVALDVSSKYVLLQQQYVSVQVAETAIASAEEAYRVTSAQVGAGTATTTDLLDAQSALTTAKLNLARAQYERAVARVQLDRAVTTR